MMDKELEAAAIGNKIIEMVQGENPLYVWENRVITGLHTAIL